MSYGFAIMMTYYAFGHVTMTTSFSLFLNNLAPSIQFTLEVKTTQLLLHSSLLKQEMIRSYHSLMSLITEQTNNLNLAFTGNPQTRIFTFTTIQPTHCAKKSFFFSFYVHYRIIAMNQYKRKLKLFTRLQTNKNTCDM